MPDPHRPLLDSRFAPATPLPVGAWVTDAERVVGEPIRTVMDKRVVPPSGDRHDYFSLAIYTWPNPDTPDGLPYIHRDGLVNPEIEQYDNAAWSRTADAIATLSRAAHAADRDDLAQAAAERVRAWFLDEATRMTPHLRHAQFVPGDCDGRPYGIIDWSIKLPDTLDAWARIAHRGLSAEEVAALDAWLATLLDWLLHSDFGLQASNLTNNHAVYYDTLAAYLLLWLSRRDEAAAILEGVGPRRIAPQIEPDGSMPRELGRTRSLTYTVMNLEGFARLATLGQHAGVDLWRWQSPDARSLRKGIAFLRQHLGDDGSWSWEQITDPPLDRAQALLQLAERVYTGEESSHAEPQSRGEEGGAE